ncbi:CheR family methyltransferase [Croceicoccus sp. YJ47]|uniref:CheR family methyltransferase n=1 Tax=Croceicoccus sp. YJ47 TaxID=2798724 RepID=UPI0021122E56|nr:CheR family methyltransferase [Croceicoccus sp. YJ47]
MRSKRRQRRATKARRWRPFPKPFAGTGARTGARRRRLTPRYGTWSGFAGSNLLRAWPFKTLFDVIFCRNVMIYFDQPTKEQLVLRLAQQLQPGAYLYIGHSERVSGEAADMLELVGPTVYRRRD